MYYITDFLPVIDPFRASLSILIGQLLFGAMLAIDARKLADDPKKLRLALYTYAIGAVFVALLTGWLTYKLSFSDCRPIPTATVEGVLDHLNGGASK